MMALYIALIAILVLSFVFLWLIAPRSPRRGMKEVLQAQTYFAHRGLHDEESPENSLPAFQKAVDAGYGIELDVQISKDGIPVVYHDDHLRRGCKIDGWVHDYTLEQLQNMPLFERDDVHIPTLAEVLELVGGKVPLIVEIKASRPEWRETLEGAMNLLEKYEGIYCIESFNPLALKQLRKHHPHVVRGQLCDYYRSWYKSSDKRMPFSMFLAQWFVMNVVARPDFIAYNCKNTNKLPFRMISHLYPDCTYIAWTTKSEADEQSSPIFSAYIFEKYIPAQKDESAS
ncbi:MAG: glycerophosphodiester phosphodiesterase [Clostridia bacterium]|nr:glycerophosphodiester phosphodiesterase [Clostridia bacterium]